MSSQVLSKPLLVLSKPLLANPLRSPASGTSASDQVRRIVNQMRKALAQSPLYQVREIEILQVQDRAILCGQVDSFYHKQIAQKTVSFARHAIEMIDEIEVCPSDQGPR